VSSNNYQIYINQTLQLVETIVIKSSSTARTLNEWVAGAMASGGYFASIDPDPTTWKYYLNLAGEYHSIDEVMTVVSMDTLEEIVFNKANMVIHRATARAYQYGTKQYTDLVARFPTQEQLILGILYPTDIDKAVNAKDGEILSYPPGLVEENEYSLISNLQKWIYHYKQRWHVPGFEYTDELYGATMLGIMYLLLVQAVLTFRLSVCNTNEAHSFHIREYLAGHGFLDKYFDSMTKKQALYFYRNIAYIERHAGKNVTLDTLIEHIMTERQIPLGEYSMKHDVSEQTETLYPEVIFRKRQLNLGIILPDDNRVTVPEMLEKEKSLAIGNTTDVEDVSVNIKELMENSPSNVVATKVLESSMIDETNSSPWILSEVLFNHWLLLSSQGIYTAYVNINNPKTGERIPLTAKEAFVFALYVFAKTVGETLVTVPLAYASRVQRIPAASVDDIYSIVDHKLIGRETAVAALAEQPKIRSLISIDAFYNLGSEINDAMQMQRRLIANQEHHEGRAMVQQMITRIYSDQIIELEPAGTAYDTWLSSRNIEVSSFSRAEFVLLYNDIVSQATGASLHPMQSMAFLQKNMVNMLTQLSSYGIQVIAEINDSTIRKTDWPGARLGTVTGSISNNPKNPDAVIGLDRFSGSLSTEVIVDMNLPGVGPTIKQYGTHHVEVDLTMDAELVAKPTTFMFKSPIGNLGITSPDPKDLVIPRGWVSFIGIEYFLSLTPEQIGDIEEPYNPPGTWNPPRKTPLNQVVVISELDGLYLTDSDRGEPLSRSITETKLGKTYPQ
jgi:hypothetical protein